MRKGMLRELEIKKNKTRPNGLEWLVMLGYITCC